MNQDIGKWTILAGILIAIGGIIWYFFGDKLGFLGNLPGDFKVEKENFRFYFPLTTLILISVLINIIIRIVKYFNVP
ncbi:MAG: DUF2905 domain-containing protein [Saprospiraceae bacterium]|jgi:hypothetical protein|nr:DUF2905 domain-containing protein [Saprospiraceae bacterium]MBP6446343.1 DUF2905 domain-containing protein [Saprospiraceae bacterium]